jgi:putative DNA primase/helicase
MTAAEQQDPDREPDDDGDDWNRSAHDRRTMSDAEHEADIRRRAAQAKRERGDYEARHRDREAAAEAAAHFARAKPGVDPDDDARGDSTGRTGAQNGAGRADGSAGAEKRTGGAGERAGDGTANHDDPKPESEAGSSGETYADAVARLAKLAPHEYDRVRKAEAKRLRAQLKTLDADVAAARAPAASAGDDFVAAVMESLNLVDHEPWPKPVDGVELFNAVAEVIGRYTYMHQGSIYAAALWTIFTHCRAAFAFSPRLAITAPERECGKSTLMEVLAMMAWRACLIGDPTGPVLFRTIEAVFPTLFVDEADMGMEDRKDLLAILNMGWRKGWRVLRNIEVRGRHVPTGFNTFTPVAVAKIGKIKGPFGSRCIPIVMHKAPHLVPDLPLEGTPERDAVHDVGRKIAKWASDHIDELRGADPFMPDGMKNRLRNNWRPLFAIAEALGVREGAAEAYAELVSGAAKTLDDDADGTRLLRACYVVFRDQTSDRLASKLLAEELAKDELSPWAEYGRDRKPITQVQLAAALAVYDIGPKKLRFGDRSLQGYERAAFKGAWREFLGIDDEAEP